LRTREYLTDKEVEKLIATARRSARYGHRDATLILVAFRHGLLASEIADLEWSQDPLSTASSPRAESAEAHPDHHYPFAHIPSLISLERRLRVYVANC
jgi:hypothetical protein